MVREQKQLINRNLFSFEKARMKVIQIQNISSKLKFEYRTQKSNVTEMSQITLKQKNGR